MTNNEAVIKVARWLGYDVRPDVTTDEIITFPKRNKEWGNVLLPAYNSYAHQLLMLAVCEKMGWGIEAGLSRDGNGYLWEIFRLNGSRLNTGTVEECAYWHKFADLPLAVINAAAKEVEG